MIAQIEDAFRKIWNSFSAVRDMQAQLISPETQKSLDDIRKRMAEIPAEMRTLSQVLAQRGWYLSMSMDFNFYSF